MSREVIKDKNGITVPQRPRRLNDNILPRGGSNHMGKFRRELINTYNACVVSGRHVQEFHDVMLAATKEVKLHMRDIEHYEEDKKKQAEELAVQANLRRKAIKAAQALDQAKSPLVKVFDFTSTSELDAWAKTLKVDLDGRKSLEFMQTDFVQKYNKLQETK